MTTDDHAPKVTIKPATRPTKRRRMVADRKTERRINERYTSRTNICSTCFTAKSTQTGRCFCDA